MKNKILKLESIVIAVIIILIFTKLSILNYIDFSSVLQSLIVISFYIFSIAGIIGIFLQKPWGYYSIYVFILISSVFLGIAPIPIITKLFPVNTATFIVILSSVILFLFTLFLQLKAFKNVNNKTT